MNNTPTPQATKTIRVLCSLEIDVEVPADMDDHQVQFMIEENSCPGTGLVGSAFDKHYQHKQEEGLYCWACSLHGKNYIIKERPINHQYR